MELIKFEDKCIISRANGYDEDGAEQTEKVYNGRCIYQQGARTYAPMSQRNSKVTLNGDIRVRENDMVIITQSNGIRRECKVKTVQNIRMPLTGTRYTRLEMEYDKVITDPED